MTAVESERTITDLELVRKLLVIIDSICQGDITFDDVQRIQGLANTYKTILDTRRV